MMHGSPVKYSPLELGKSLPLAASVHFVYKALFSLMH